MFEVTQTSDEGCGWVRWPIIPLRPDSLCWTVAEKRFRRGNFEEHKASPTSRKSLRIRAPCPVARQEGPFAERAMYRCTMC